MNHRTITATFAAPRDEVFAYLAQIENLTERATEFARELKVVDGRHKVVNGLGEFFFEIEADPESGVIDMFTGLSTDGLALFPTRVVPLTDGGSAFTFTMFQQPPSRTSNSTASTRHSSASSTTSSDASARHANELRSSPVQKLEQPASIHFGLKPRGGGRRESNPRPQPRGLRGIRLCGE